MIAPDVETQEILTDSGGNVVQSASWLSPPSTETTAWMRGTVQGRSENGDTDMRHLDLDRLKTIAAFSDRPALSNPLEKYSNNMTSEVKGATRLQDLQPGLSENIQEWHFSVSGALGFQLLRFTAFGKESLGDKR